MNATELKVGQLVQLNPDTVRNTRFAACIGVVTEPKSWGAQMWIQVPSEGHAKMTFYRATWEEMELCNNGNTVWMYANGDES